MRSARPLEDRSQKLSISCCALPSYLPANSERWGGVPTKLNARIREFHAQLKTSAANPRGDQAAIETGRVAGLERKKQTARRLGGRSITSGRDGLFPPGFAPVVLHGVSAVA